MLEFSDAPHQRPNTQPVKNENKEKQKPDADDFGSLREPVRRENADGDGLDDGTGKAIAGRLLEIELIAAWREVAVERGAVGAGIFPLRIEAKEAVAEVIGNAGQRRGESNFEIARVRSNGDTFFEGERGLIEEDRVDEGLGLNVGARVMDRDARCAGQGGVAILSCGVRLAERGLAEGGASRSEGSERGGQQQKGQRNLES